MVSKDECIEIAYDAHSLLSGTIDTMPTDYFLLDIFVYCVSLLVVYCIVIVAMYMVN